MVLVVVVVLLLLLSLTSSLLLLLPLSRHSRLVPPTPPNAPRTQALHKSNHHPTTLALLSAIPHAVVFLPAPPQSKGGAANESVLVDDLKDFVKGAVRLVHGVAKSSGGGDAAKKGEGGADGEDTPTAYSHR